MMMMMPMTFSTGTDVGSLLFKSWTVTTGSRKKFIVWEIQGSDMRFVQEYAGAAVVTLAMGVAFECIRNARPKVAKLLVPKKCCQSKGCPGSITSDEVMLVLPVQATPKFEQIHSVMLTWGLGFT